MWYHRFQQYFFAYQDNNRRLWYSRQARGADCNRIISQGRTTMVPPKIPQVISACRNIVEIAMKLCHYMT